MLPRALRKISYCLTWILFHGFLPLPFVSLEENRKGVFTYNWDITFYTLMPSAFPPHHVYKVVIFPDAFLCALWSVSIEMLCPKLGAVLERRSRQH